MNMHGPEVVNQFTVVGVQLFVTIKEARATEVT
jgi:hypothetical protein